VTGARLVAIWLVSLSVSSLALAAARGDIASAVFPLLLASAGFLLLTRSGRTLPRFPSTDLERGLNRLFELLLPTRKAPTATVRAAVAHQTRLARLRHSTRRWGKELQQFRTDGYETASRISALSTPTGSQDERALVTEAIRVLRAERASAGADVAPADDAVSILAYGLGVRPADADLTSLDDLLRDLGLAGESDELRTHFDDILSAQTTSANPRLKNDAERSMFRDLAGASFVLGASARILELAAHTTPGDPPLRPRAAIRA
jgi:hypothetical protein